MSKYSHAPLSFQGLKTVPIQARGGKVRIEHFGKPFAGGSIADFLDSLPHILAADSFRSVVDPLVAPRPRKKIISGGLGVPAIKCGPRPISSISCVEAMRRASH